jgi:Sec-independent protein translocase protein TatA
MNRDILLYLIPRQALHMLILLMLQLFVIGKKSLPEIRKSEARASERYWARVGGIFQDQNELTKELFLR